MIEILSKRTKLDDYLAKCRSSKATLGWLFKKTLSKSMLYYWLFQGVYWDPKCFRYSGSTIVRLQAPLHSYVFGSHYTEWGSLLCITVSWATDKYIVQDCVFLNCGEPYEQIMADRGFKIREELLLRNASLIVYSTKHKTGMQMVAGDVREASRIANVKIYVEQAIGWLKQFHIVKNILPINYLPLCDDIVQVVCALTWF